MRVLFFSTWLTLISLNIFGSIDKKHFYDVFKSDSIDRIEALINVYENIDEENILAFKGALYIKKSGLMHEAKKKIELFKKGRNLLEKSITQHPDNIEFRFLRFIIQESAPPFLRYHCNKDEDAKIVRAGVSSLEKDVQDAIFDYSKKSSFLNFD